MSDQINSRAERRRKLEQERSKTKRKGKKPKKGNIFKKILLAIVAVGLALFIGGVGLFAYYASTAPKLDEKLLKDPVTSEFLDADGNVFMKFGTERREYVEYKDIPKQMEDAILATEDVRFYSHHGMDFWRLGGAVLANFKSGFGSQGASTLTQQVIKNSFLSEEKTLKRKAQEAWLAFQLERKYEKEEIFEMYFNKVLMSGRVHGFGTGADYFFGKDLDELDLPEMAMLAGMPQYPNGYNPYKNPERAEKRRNVVLKLMVQHKKISQEEADKAKAVTIASMILPEDKRPVNTETKYPAYVDIVLDELEEAGMSDILSDGVKIQTSLNPKAQEAVESAINNGDWYESEKMEAGMTVVDTKTGAIVAVGGGRDYAGRDLNFASDQKRQPGSAIKPILSYGPAIENFSWSTGQVTKDEPYNYKGTNIPIRNVDGRYQGSISIREALFRSRNVPAVKIFEEVGPSKAADFAKGLGLPVGKLDSSNAIGGGEIEFSTVQMAGAYAAFGNGGIYTKPHAVTKIIFRDGTPRNLTPNAKPVMKDSTAYMVTDILRDVMTERTGTGTVANVSGMDIAGKTGTTNYPSEIKNKYGLKDGAVPDSWFVGYSSEYTIATWGGYKNYTDPIMTIDRGRQVPQKLFKSVMSSIGSGSAAFKKPGSVEEARVIYGSDPLVLAGNYSSGQTRMELFVSGTLPKQQAPEEVLELSPVSGLNAQYDADANTIGLQWSHTPPDPELTNDPVVFDVFVAVDGSEKQLMTSTSEMAVTFNAAETGRTYEFTVVAKSGSLESAPASTSLQIQEVEEEEPEIEEPDIDEDFDEDDDNENNQGNGENQGNQGNGNNPGNQGNGNNQGNQGNQNNQGNGNNQGNQGNQGQGNQGNQNPPGLPNNGQNNDSIFNPEQPGSNIPGTGGSDDDNNN